jgi:hypothetical protein
VKHIKNVLHEMYDDSGTWQIEVQSKYLETYKINAIQVGRMCDKYPSLQKAWDEFKLVYEICRSQDEADNQNT